MAGEAAFASKYFVSHVLIIASTGQRAPQICGIHARHGHHEHEHRQHTNCEPTSEVIVIGPQDEPGRLCGERAAMRGPATQDARERDEGSESRASLALDVERQAHANRSVEEKTDEDKDEELRRRPGQVVSQQMVSGMSKTQERCSCDERNEFPVAHVISSHLNQRTPALSCYETLLFSRDWLGNGEEMGSSLSQYLRATNCEKWSGRGLPCTLPDGAR